MRPTTNIERSVDLLLANGARVNTNTIGVITRERRAEAYKYLDNMEEYIFRIREELDALVY
jgi:hypothetical protein